jgi:hypothetical protein
MSKIKIAIPSDEDELISLIKIKTEEDGIAPFDEERTRFTVRRGLIPGETHRQAIIGIIRGPREIEASIGLYMSGWWFSSTPHLSDLWAFVAPNYRRSEHAKSLLEFSKWASSTLNTPLLMHEIINAKTANKVKLIERKLGPQGGALFYYDPKIEIAKAAA